MNILRRINLILVTVLSLAAAIPKIAQIPGEVEFFNSMGLGKGALLMFGALQLAGGALLVFGKTRLWGASVAALAFLGSAVMLFLNGQSSFGAVSLLPVIMSCVVFFDVARNKEFTSA
jgi:hypothetical protein